MNSAIRSVLRQVRSEAIIAFFCHKDPRAISVINFVDSLFNSDGSVSGEAILVADEVLKKSSE